mmetsp:Transcript_67622/g.163468  ORF Transcript_67622/g.163468 Transcript_67622/m.163468 type:complete len:434 (+) Transcript_67622:807-2108(+)
MRLPLHLQVKLQADIARAVERGDESRLEASGARVTALLEAAVPIEHRRVLTHQLALGGDGGLWNVLERLDEVLAGHDARLGDVHPQLLVRYGLGKGEGVREVEIFAEDDGDAAVDDRLVEGGARQRFAARLQAEGRVGHRGERAVDARALAVRAVDGRPGLGGHVLDERVVAVVGNDVHAQPLADVGAAERALPVVVGGRRDRVARRARTAVQARVGVWLDDGGVEHECAAHVALGLLRLAAPARVELLDDARALVGGGEDELRHDDVGRAVVVGRAHLVGHDVQLAVERGRLALERAAGGILARAHRAIGHEDGRVGVPHVVVEDVFGKLLMEAGALLRRARAHVRAAAVGGHVDEVRLERVAREVRVVLHGVMVPHLQIVFGVGHAVALLLAKRKGRVVPPLVDRRARQHLLGPGVAQRHHVHARRLLHEL